MKATTSGPFQTKRPGKSPRMILVKTESSVWGEELVMDATLRGAEDWGECFCPSEPNCLSEQPVWAIALAIDCKR